MCRSEPQIAVDVILTIASRGLTMLGSATVSTRTSWGPYQQSALITTSSCAGTQLRLDSGFQFFHYSSTARRLPFGRRDFSCFHQFFEVAQILSDFLFGYFAEYFPYRNTRFTSKLWVVEF